jgi:hypothetical protein
MTWCIWKKTGENKATSLQNAVCDHLSNTNIKNSYHFTYISFGKLLNNTLKYKNWSQMMAYVKNTLPIMAHYHKTYPKCEEQRTFELYKVLTFGNVYFTSFFRKSLSWNTFNQWYHKMNPICATNFLRSWCSGSIATTVLPCSYTHWALQQIDIWTITSVICHLQNLQWTAPNTDSNTCTRYADEIIKIQLVQMFIVHIQRKYFSQTILEVHSYDSMCYRQNACKKTGTKQCCSSVK